MNPNPLRFLMTAAQKDTLRKLMSGADITLREAIDGSGFTPETIGTHVGIPGDELRQRMEAGEKVTQLPDLWKTKLKLAALKLGISST